MEQVRKRREELENEQEKARYGSRLVASSSPASAICTVLSFSGMRCAALRKIYATEEAPHNPSEVGALFVRHFCQL